MGVILVGVWCMYAANAWRKCTTGSVCVSYGLKSTARRCWYLLVLKLIIIMVDMDVPYMYLAGSALSCSFFLLSYMGIVPS